MPQDVSQEDTSQAFTIAYRHGEEIKVKSPSLISQEFLLLPLIGTIACGFFFPSLIIHCLVVVILLMAICPFLTSSSSANRQQLFLGPRYLICGNKVIYYQNITSFAQNDDRITLYSDSKELLSIYRNKFVSVSSKAEKIKANLDRKFNLTKSELIKRMMQANPQLRVSSLSTINLTKESRQ